MIDANNVTACLVTRGDVDMQQILDSLIFDRVVIWDNSERTMDWKVAGRYLAAYEAPTRFVYWQDDDTIVPRETQRALLHAFETNIGAASHDIVANWGHGDNPDGYDDLPLVCGGAVADSMAAWRCILRYAQEYPLDDGFQHEADFVVGVLYQRWEHLHLPFTIRDVAYNGKRLADEPWQKELKLELTNRARAIRDRNLVAA